MKHECSLPCSQELTSEPYPTPDDFSLYPSSPFL